MWFQMYQTQHRLRGKGEDGSNHDTKCSAGKNRRKSSVGGTFTVSGAKIMINYYGGTGTDHGVKREDHSEKLCGGSHRSDCIIGIMREHQGIDGSHCV